MIYITTKRAILLCCLLLPMSATAMEALPQSTGTSCDIAVDEKSNHLQQSMETWLTDSRRSNEEYLQKIQQIESSEGVFSHDLLPELIGLGLINQEQENYSASSEAFQRALHVIRVNEGLYSISQLPLIDFLIESNSARGEWKQVADSYDLMYWLYRRNYDAGDPRQLSTLKRLRNWYMESYNKDTGRRLEELFTKSEKLYEQALKIMWECTGGDKRQSACFWHKTCCAGAEPTLGMCPLDRS